MINCCAHLQIDLCQTIIIFITIILIDIVTNALEDCERPCLITRRSTSHLHNVIKRVKRYKIESARGQIGKEK